MKRTLNRSVGQEGFTIVELMVATTVFSVVLLLCTYGLLAIGRSYYKGVTISRTQETARLIIDDVTEAIQFNDGAVVVNVPAARWYCIGSERYSFELNRVKTETNHVLVTDTVGGCSGGTGRSGQVDGNSLALGFTELMSTRMRLSRFEVIRISDNLYRVNVKVISGEDDMLVAADGDGVVDDCTNERSGSQFCAVAELSTVVHKRV